MEFLNRDTSELDRTDPIANIRIVQEWLNYHSFDISDKRFSIYHDKIVFKVPSQIALAWSKIGMTSIYWVTRSYDDKFKPGRFSAIISFSDGSIWREFNLNLVIDFTTQDRNHPGLLRTNPINPNIKFIDDDNVEIVIYTKSCAVNLWNIITNGIGMNEKEASRFRDNFCADFIPIEDLSEDDFAEKKECPTVHTSAFLKPDNDTMVIQLSAKFSDIFHNKEKILENSRVILERAFKEAGL